MNRHSRMRATLVLCGSWMLLSLFFGITAFGDEVDVQSGWRSSSVDPEVIPVQNAEPKPQVIERILPNKEVAPPADPLPMVGKQFGGTPKVTPEVKERYKRFVASFVDPENTLDLVQLRSRLMLLKEAPKRVQISDETVVSSTIVSPQEVSLTGKKVGTTVLTLWFTDPKDKNKDAILSYLVRVLPDPELKERTDRVYEALALSINKAFPDSNIKLTMVGDKMVASGWAKDLQEGFQILRIVQANAQRQNSPATIPVNQLNVTVTPEVLADAEGNGEQTLENFLIAGGRNVINQIRIAGEQQVMLRVTVAEVNRSAARSIGVNFAVSNNNGLVAANLTGSLLTNSSSGTINFGGSGGSSSSGINLPIRLDGGQILLAINALKSLNLAKSLAEPNLVTMDGKQASFMAGGEFPVPVVTGATSVGLQGVNFIPFGVQLRFTPFITDRDRIRLTVNASVSNRDNATSANINGTSVPSLNVRTFQTTVDLREGQTLAVAGLIQNNYGSTATRIPFFGDIPFFGRLFGVDTTSCADQELVFLITPELVHPIDRHELQPLPGQGWVSPSDVEFYLCSKLLSMRGMPGIQQTTSAMTPESTLPALSPADDRKRTQIEEKLLIGPGGYSKRSESK